MDSYKGLQKALEMTLVLLNDVNDSHTPRLFLVHVSAIMALQQSSLKNQRTSFRDETSDQEQCLSWIKKRNKGTQTLEHSFIMKAQLM